MKTIQFEDKQLAHYSYAIISKGEMALIDPTRNPQPYYELAKQHDTKITVVIETHPHADFVSSHLQIHQDTGATIYTSKLVGAGYPHQPFDEGDVIHLGEIKLKSLSTPGHSPDSISIVVIEKDGKQSAVFTGDTLFIGDCGRPDLRENVGNITGKSAELARQMYHSLRNKLMRLPDETIVYPAHGSGSLCGKALSEQNMSTIGQEKYSNWSLQPMSEEKFVHELLADQPFIPRYFGFNVGLNKKGAENFSTAVSRVPVTTVAVSANFVKALNPGIVKIDARPPYQFLSSGIKDAINLVGDLKFETWLGSIIKPGEPFYLITESEQDLRELIERIAKIGYESQIALGMIKQETVTTADDFDRLFFEQHQDDFTVVDVRNPSEVATNKIFENAINIPLYELRERSYEIPMNKPIVVHCAGGYRSAIGSSIIRANSGGKAEVHDLSEAVLEFQK